MKKPILLIMMLTVVLTSFGQKKTTQKSPQKSPQKYLTYDEYTNISEKLNQENYSLKDSIYYRGKKSTCLKHEHFIKIFNNFKEYRSGNREEIYMTEYDKYISYDSALKLMEVDTIDYSYKFPKNPIQYFIENDTYPNRYNYKIMKDYINKLSQKDNDSINKCISNFENYKIKINKQISLNESKIEKYLYLRDNFSGTWGWITLYNGKRVWARYSNGTYFY